MGHRAKHREAARKRREERIQQGLPPNPTPRKQRKVDTDDLVVLDEVSDVQP